MNTENVFLSVGNAAWKRDREKNTPATRQCAGVGSESPSVLKNTTDIIPQSAPVGNAAAMREALLWVIDRMNAALIDGKMECEETIDKCKSALSAPARNCDKFRTADEADKAFNEFCAAERTGKCKPAECSLPSGTGAKSCQLAWLFAKEAQEGGAE